MAETICAISTPPGTGGIAVIRVSGDDALGICNKLWEGKSLIDCPSHTTHLGWIKAADETIDQAVATVFRGPNSYTGENTVELSVHGGRWIQQEVIQALVSQGCRLAEPGEFTRRAVLSGCLTLVQAEGVADLIQARNRSQALLAQNQLRGRLNDKIHLLKEDLLRVLSLLELELDFSEEEVEFASRDDVKRLLKACLDYVGELKDSFATGQAIKEGIPVAIVGAPNVGKSTLLNALVHDDRAIVSPIAGTTRDTVEETFEVGGYLYRFIDTAGLHQSQDAIEQMGIARSLEAVSRASVVIWVKAADTPHGQEEEIERSIREKLRPEAKLIELENKSDLTGSCAPHSISALDAETTREKVIGLISEVSAPECGDVIITNLRHFQSLAQAYESLSHAQELLLRGAATEFVVQEMRYGVNALDTLLGKITTPDILHNIFSHFCIGK